MSPLAEDLKARELARRLQETRRSYGPNYDISRSRNGSALIKLSNLNFLLTIGIASFVEIRAKLGTFGLLHKNVGILFRLMMCFTK